MKPGTTLAIKATILFMLTVLMSFGAKKNRQPNIIFLLADDLRFDVFGFMGNPIIKTPGIDRLAHQGTVFRNAYVTTSICAISRASFFTGQYSARHGIHDFVTNFSDLARSNNYPTILKSNGYYTGFIGKYGVGNKMPVTEFDYWKGFPGMGSYVQKNSKGGYKHLTELQGDQAEDFLKGASRNKPFCLSISFKAPHVEGTNTFLPDPADSALYANDYIVPPVTGNDRFFEAFPEVFRTNNEARSRWQVRFSSPELYQENVKKYYRLVTEIDNVVRRIRDVLEKRGLADNTIIIFTSDNGFYLGEHGLAGKWYGHNESIRVPLIIFDPRIPETGRTPSTDKIALNIDIAPTILDYAGIKVPEMMQGKSLKPLQEGKRGNWRNDFYYDHLLDSAKVYIPHSEGVVGKVYKYIRYYNGRNPDDYFYEELFDTKIDPYEVNNLANSHHAVDVKKDMIKTMKSYRTKVKKNFGETD